MGAKIESREYGDCLLGIEKLPTGNRYTIIGSKRTIIEFIILDNGELVYPR